MAKIQIKIISEEDPNFSRLISNEEHHLIQTHEDNMMRVKGDPLLRHAFNELAARALQQALKTVVENEEQLKAAKKSPTDEQVVSIVLADELHRDR